MSILRSIVFPNSIWAWGSLLIHEEIPLFVMIHFIKIKGQIKYIGGNIDMDKEERLNEEAALNNNLDSSTLRMNDDITKQHQKPKPDQSDKQKRADKQDQS